MRICSGVESSYSSSTINSLRQDRILAANNHIKQVKNHIQETPFKQLEGKINFVNKKLKYNDIKLEYSIHEETNRVMVKVLDRQEQSLIKEIPSERMLDIIAQIQDAVGILVDQRV
ncbi:flagellar protein FlaG [Desulfitispora alkaliphila]|uniref:flagellar protein FlaG n=1 Tax=Desulfitispora alkaliphila TaxID=622674 RepID=UPI003D20D2F6